VGVPIAVGGVVVAVGVVLGGTFVFAGDESERGGGQTAGPAPTTVLSLPEPGPSGEEPIPEPGDPYPPVPSGQVDGLPYSTVRITGRNLYIPVLDSNCWREEVWPRGEYADRVEVEIRELPPHTAARAHRRRGRDLHLLPGERRSEQRARGDRVGRAVG
jgi:hypothetical protein